MERIKWQQHEFSSWDLRKPGFLDSLRTQREALQEVEEAAEEGDPILTSAAVAELDLDLLRYACGNLHQQLVAAVKNDGACLLAMTVAGTDSDRVQKNWEGWLEGGEVWQILLKSEWLGIKHRAVKQICSAIQNDGPDLSKSIVQEIEQAVGGLKLEEVLGPDLFTRFYSGSDSETSDEVVEPEDTF